MMQSIQSYLNMITSQYQNSPKFLEWLRAVLLIIDDIAVCANAMPDYFDIDKAVGVQLDVIGIILGQLRTLQFQPTDGSPAQLDDATYRKVLKLKTLTNYWDGSAGEIYLAWKTVFPDVDLVVTDNQDMTATVVFTGGLSQIVIDMIDQDLIIPRPEGVQYNFGGTVAVLPIFTYDSDNVYFKGYDEGIWDSSLA